MSDHHHSHGQHQCHQHHGGTARAVFISLTVNITLTVLKWLAFLVTWSPSLFGEAAHSTADTLNPLLLWFGYRRSRRPKDADHPLGHGREVFFWSLMAAQMMFIVGCVATAYHGIESLATGRVPEMSWWAGGIMLFALMAEGYSFVVAWRNLKSSNASGRASAGDAVRSKNPVVLALVMENGVDMLGVLLAVCGYGFYLATGQPIWDGIFSLCIATLLACSSIFLIRRNLSLIIGENADKETHGRIISTLTGASTVLEVRNVIAVMTGPEEIRCRVQVQINHVVLLANFQTALLAGTLEEKDPVLWTVAYFRQEKQSLIKALEVSVSEVVQVEIDCY
ncbi:cation diffusion facilitator family transporter [Patescibacteria group bacterium]|nr:cation diffusion facilitator family transporter [Patescibacteria group bacterium]MBU1029253.1 cation diffusion facilitator family transporter [Patescibacteria group bacterium]MBU1915981.1 cation diffusion facilitator family transporter [Patescibacteria group bacterium]